MKPRHQINLVEIFGRVPVSEYLIQQIFVLF